MTGLYFVIQMVKKRDIGRGGGKNLGIWRYVTFERHLIIS